MRPNIHESMMETAHVWAKRSTCAKRSVGAVIASGDKRVLGIGYNGVPAGELHCTMDPCVAHCEGLHAEINAMVNCPKLDEAYIIYVTCPPCWHCTKALAATKIQVIVFYEVEPYDLTAIKYWQKLGRHILQLKEIRGLL